jgi:hypothetical protein
MSRNRRFLVAALAVVILGAAAGLGVLVLSPAQAAVGPLPAEALLLPADVRFVGGFDVKRFVASPFYARFASAKASRPETFRELEQKTGLNPERDLDQVIVAGRGPGSAGDDGGLAVVLGRFDRARINRLIETERKGVTSKDLRGTALYLFNEGESRAKAIAFLDDRTLVLGSQAAVEAAVVARAEGQHPLKANKTILALLETVRPGSTFWAVGDQSLLSNMPKNVPAPGGQGATLTLPGLKSLTVSGDVDPVVSFELIGRAEDETAAKSLGDVVRGFVALASLQANQRPEFKELAAAISVTNDADSVRVNARVPYELIDALQKKPEMPAQAPASPMPR